MKSYIEYISEKRVPDSEDIEMKEVEKIAAANKSDLQEYPGKKGEAKHHKLHRVLKGFVDKMRTLHKKYK